MQQGGVGKVTTATYSLLQSAVTTSFLDCQGEALQPRRLLGCSWRVRKHSLTCSSASMSEGLELWKAPEQINRTWSVLTLPYFVCTTLPVVGAQGCKERTRAGQLVCRGVVHRALLLLTVT